MAKLEAPTGACPHCEAYQLLYYKGRWYCARCWRERSDTGE